jgi:hypothetical protein
LCFESGVVFASILERGVRDGFTTQERVNYCAYSPDVRFDADETVLVRFVALFLGMISEVCCGWREYLLVTCSLVWLASG